MTRLRPAVRVSTRLKHSSMPSRFSFTTMPGIVVVVDVVVVDAVVDVDVVPSPVTSRLGSVSASLSAASAAAAGSERPVGSPSSPLHPIARTTTVNSEHTSRGGRNTGSRLDGG